MIAAKSFQAASPGKVILFGEHAVVYGRPAIAVPVTQVQAEVTVCLDAESAPGGRIISSETGLNARLDEMPSDFWGRVVVRSVCQAAGLPGSPRFTMRIRSTIPVAAGLGSGAAVATAAIRALAAYFGLDPPAEQVNLMAFEVEKGHHGTPSGIDNTVVTYAKPVFFVRGRTLETLQVGRSFEIVIADTGVPSPTAATVADVRTGWLREPDKFERLFDQAGDIAVQARAAIEEGHPNRLGPLMNANHAALQAMGVSSPDIDRLVATALTSGAAGAKLSGGGRGGNLIAMPGDQSAENIAQNMKRAGALRTIITQIEKSRHDNPT